MLSTHAWIAAGCATVGGRIVASWGQMRTDGPLTRCPAEETGKDSRMAVALTSQAMALTYEGSSGRSFRRDFFSEARELLV